MRVLRATYFTDPKTPSVVIIRDCDIIDTLESVAITAVDSFREGFVTYDIFDMPDADIPEATIVAGRRTAKVADQEKHQATLYFHLAGIWEHGLPGSGRMPRTGATMYGDENMPLSAHEIRVVYEQLAQHPLYDHFTLSYPDKHGRMVTLRDGVIE